MTGLILRDVEVDGRSLVDVRLINGRIAEIGARIDRLGCDEIDGRGGALLPGLIDHHLHLFGLAAAIESVDASLAATPDVGAFTRALQAADARLAPGAWMRIIGYDDAIAGPMSREALDRILPNRPVKLQFRTGGLWSMNTAALSHLRPSVSLPSGVECDAAGRPTGRVFREDLWMREALPASPPSLAEVARRLNRYGVTGVTDASVTTDAATATVLAEAARIAGLRQHLTLMSGGPLSAPADGAFAVGPVKVLLDDDRLGDPADMADTIRAARTWSRAVAVHCVTAGELAYALAAFEDAGARAGDRIEHGGVLDDPAVEALSALHLTVVTQPGFVLDRGDRYLKQVPEADHPNLYRIAGLRRRGVRMAASSDAPYATLDPWQAMRAAVDRKTRDGQILCLAEGVSPPEALSLYMGSASDPGGPARRIEIGAPANLCLMAVPIAEVLDALSADAVAATLIDGVPA